MTDQEIEIRNLADAIREYQRWQRRTEKFKEQRRLERQRKRGQRNAEKTDRTTDQ